MPNYTYAAPGAAIADELEQILAERRAQAQQKFVNSITLRHEDRADKQEAAQAEDRKAMAADRLAQEKLRNMQMAGLWRQNATSGQEVPDDEKEAYHVPGAWLNPSMPASQPQGPASPEGGLLPPDPAIPATLKPTDKEQKDITKEAGKQNFLESLKGLDADSLTPAERIRIALEGKDFFGENFPSQFIAPKEPTAAKPTTNIQDYEYAVKQGYKGSFQQFRKEQANNRDFAPEHESFSYQPELDAKTHLPTGRFLKFSNRGGDPTVVQAPGTGITPHSFPPGFGRPTRGSMVDKIPPQLYNSLTLAQVGTTPKHSWLSGDYVDPKQATALSQTQHAILDHLRRVDASNAHVYDTATDVINSNPVKTPSSQIAADIAAANPSMPAEEKDLLEATLTLLRNK